MRNYVLPSLRDDATKRQRGSTDSCLISRGSIITRQDTTMRFAEEILLLLYNEAHGDFILGPAPDSLNIILAGAVLMDLALENCIDTDIENLFLINSTPLGDDLLDPALSEIARDTNARDISYWVTQTAKRGEEIRDKAIARLIERGILQSEFEENFSLSSTVSRSRRYPAVEGKAVEDVRLRVMRVLFTDDIPDERDIVIICLADACGVFENILSRSEWEEVRERVEQVRKMDLIGQSVAEAVRKLELEVQARYSPPRKEIPSAPGLPFIGNAIDMASDLRSFLVRQYRDLGPIFSIRALNHRFIVLAGPEANNFVSQGNQYFRSHELWASFNADMGASRYIISTDGPEHTRMRRDHAQVYSRKLIEERIDDAVRIMQREVEEWPQNKSFEALRACRRIITQQIGYMATGVSVQDYVDDIIYFSSIMTSTHLSRHVPGLARSLPRFRHSRKRVEELIQKILADHEPQKRPGKSFDFVDRLLELNLKEPYYAPEANFSIWLLGPFVAGLDTAASACAFILYELLKRPALLEQTITEADALFARGMPSMNSVSQLDVIHRVVKETLRIYPLASAVSRTVANSFEFEGYTVPAGATVLLAFTVPHHMEEYFPDPQRFDIERFAAKRDERRPPGVYAPFGVGAHRCLGSSLAEALIAINIAYIIHTTELVLDPPDYKLKTRQLPGLHPHKSLKLRLASRRQ